MKHVRQYVQDPLFGYPYRYIFDTNVIFAQNPPPQRYPRAVYAEMWRLIDELVTKQEIVICGQIKREVVDRGDVASEWLKTCGIKVIEENDSIQNTVKLIVNEHPEILRFKRSNNSSGDVFLIATAIEHDLVIVTQESGSSPKKIPQIAKYYGVTSVDLAGFCELKGWVF